MPETRLQAIERILGRAEYRLKSIEEDEHSQIDDVSTTALKMLRTDIREALGFAKPTDSPTVTAALHHLTLAEQRLVNLDRDPAAGFLNGAVKATLGDLKVLIDAITGGLLTAAPVPVRPAQLNAELAIAGSRCRRADHLNEAARRSLDAILPDVEDRGVVEAKLDEATASVDRVAVHLAAARDAIDRALGRAVVA